MHFYPDGVVEQVSEIRFIGAIMDEEQTWKSHVAWKMFSIVF